MSIDPTIGAIAPGNAAASAESRASDAATRQKIKLMAEEFEAMLMTQMLRDMRQSMLSDEDEEKGLGKDSMTDSIDIEMGRVISRAGGFGLAKALTHALDQRLGLAPVAAPPVAAFSPYTSVEQVQAPAAPLEAAHADPAPAAEAQDEHALQMPHGRISSTFGWRHDPFTGAARFHQGIDVAQAYGQDVRAAAGGRVAFAGDQGSYGTTIVIEHAGGRQTRYAHLSATDVRPGDVVDPWQVIGKSGSSGRSTGPHLHFEVLEGGRPVDPAGA